MLAQVLAAIMLAGMGGLADPMTSASNNPQPPTVANPIKGLDLWRGAKVGMSETEVRRLFPLAQPPAKPTILTGGQWERLQLDAVDLNGQAATAHFYFASSQLVIVELTASGFESGQPTRNMVLAKSIAASYSATYGQGYDCDLKSLGDISAFECKWLKGPLSIQLWYMDVAGQAPLFHVAYRQADDPSYNL